MKATRNGTVLTMELDVQPGPEKKTAKFHRAFLGDYLHDDTTVSRSFAPLSIPGHGTFTETVRFYPMDVGLPYVVDDKGDYRFTLKFVTAKRQSPDFVEQYGHREPQPLTFERTLPGLAPQYLSEQHGTQAMFSKSGSQPRRRPRNPLTPRMSPRLQIQPRRQHARHRDRQLGCVNEDVISCRGFR
jgi:hypothetical protein